MPNAFQPMGEMNTTPLIDVLFVLLVMVIISIPAATHSLDVDLPRPCKYCPPVGSVANKLIVDEADRLRWNGEIVTPDQLVALLENTARMAVEPELQFEPAARASYDASARALNIIKASGVTKFGFVGNERFRVFGKTD